MKISFFFPSHKIGGVEYLYARIAEEVYKLDYQIEIIDYTDGSMYKLLNSRSIPFDFIVYNGKAVNPLGQVCVTSLLYLPNSKQKFTGHCRFLFWDDHPYNLILHLRHLKLIHVFNISIFKLICILIKTKRYFFLKSILNKAISKKGVVFMCGYNYHLNNFFFNIKETPQFLSIPITLKKTVYQPIEHDYIECSYLGRLDHDKYFICSELMHDIIRYNKGNKIKVRLHIIGDGSEINKIKIIANKYPKFFILKGILKGQQLDEFLSHSINLSFAIGTSALETAALAIPTAYLRDTSQKRFKNNYLWIFDASQYDLSITHAITQIQSLDGLISQYLANRELICKKCYSYVLNRHSISTIVDNFRLHIENTTLRLTDL